MECDIYKTEFAHSLFFFETLISAPRLLTKILRTEYSHLVLELSHLKNDYWCNFPKTLTFNISRREHATRKRQLPWESAQNSLQIKKKKRDPKRLFFSLIFDPKVHGYTPLCSIVFGDPKKKFVFFVLLTRRDEIIKTLPRHLNRRERQNLTCMTDNHLVHFIYRGI